MFKIDVQPVQLRSVSDTGRDGVEVDCSGRRLSGLTTSVYVEESSFVDQRSSIIDAAGGRQPPGAAFAKIMKITSPWK